MCMTGWCVHGVCCYSLLYEGVSDCMVVDVLCYNVLACIIYVCMVMCDVVS